MSADLVRYARDIEDARAKVAEAQLKYSRGAGVDVINRANRQLADAHDAYRECSGNRVPDQR
jgi:hypothetical protein